jgi:hypothetical protein
MSLSSKIGLFEALELTRRSCDIMKYTARMSRNSSVSGYVHDCVGGVRFPVVVLDFFPYYHYIQACFEAVANSNSGVKAAEPCSNIHKPFLRRSKMHLILSL